VPRQLTAATLDTAQPRAAVRGSRLRTAKLSALLWLGLQACAAREGALLVRDTASDAGSDPTKLRAAVRPNMSLQYQITGQLDTQVDAQLFVIDLFESSAAQVAELHAAGRIVMAYVSVGSLENWRSDASNFPSSAVGMPLAAYPDESWLDIRNAQVRALMTQRFERALEKGFDGVFASTLGGYLARSGFDLTSADQLDYDKFLAAKAHLSGLSIGLSEDFALDPALVTAFDWALAIGCIAQHDCSALATWQARGRAVFDLETEGDHATVCMQATSYGLPVTFKHTAYDAYRSTCP
jgi:hypothetical protein